MKFEATDERGMYAPAHCRSTKDDPKDRTSRCVDIGSRRFNGCWRSGCLGTHQLDVNNDDEYDDCADDDDNGCARADDDDNGCARADDDDNGCARADDDNDSCTDHHDDGTGDGLDDRASDRHDLAIRNDQVR